MRDHLPLCPLLIYYLLFVGCIDGPGYLYFGGWTNWMGSYTYDDGNGRGG